MSTQVKLIVCDVDGTLLKKNETKPSPDVLNMIENIRKSGKLFALSSGRSKNNLLRLFPDSRDIFLIPSDGSGISVNGELIYSKPIEPQILAKILPHLRGADFILYSSDSCFASTDFIADFVRSAENGKVLALNNLRKTDLIYKLAIFKMRYFPLYAENYIKNNRLLNICYDKPDLKEFVSPKADKGEALFFLQNRYNIKYEETAAFGDNFNDILMLKRAHFSYAVSGARPEIKALARFYTENAANEIVNNLIY